MDKTRLPPDIQALDARLATNPELTQGMGRPSILTVIGRSSGQPRSTPVSPVTYDGYRWIIAEAARHPVFQIQD